MIMLPQKSSQRVLLAILALNIASTWFHYTDNALFLEQYPGPDWITPSGIFATVAAMTPAGLLGYWLYTRSNFGVAYLILSVYSITSLSSPVHYLYPMVVPMSVKMHGSILLDAVAGLTLVAFLLWSGLIAQEWRIGGQLQRENR
ncbi:MULTISPECIES: hypothetical protein [unclassified Leptolyngbya]|uniref:hypothetical protein n=1 Tax=unclassified Leptolyngbya TaxID=2650499 RepID=UPI001688600F|nr:MULTISPECIES: hypothetical protein [unclassified Leptolyngbya]MBD1912726.1 hypothetical protein [Leptolyngbya sp. FACHB-8]MBD2154651.1 hypothetical protein [Leptolyngbya sp. FACHB-16]